eukprot:5166344-Pleurochrysis_carterae.AAC.2
MRARLRGLQHRHRALQEEERHALALERRRNEAFVDDRLPEGTQRARVRQSHLLRVGRCRFRLDARLMRFLAFLLIGFLRLPIVHTARWLFDAIGRSRLLGQVEQHLVPDGVQTRVHARSALQRAQERGKVGWREEAARLGQRDVGQQRGKHRARHVAREPQRDHQHVRRPAINRLLSAQLSEKVTDQGGRHLLQKGLPLRALQQLGEESAHDVLAPLGRQARHAGRADDCSAADNASVEHVSLLGAFQAAVYLHALCHLIQDPLRRHALKRHEHLDQRGAEALISAPQRTTHQTGQLLSEAALIQVTYQQSCKEGL